jgi:phage gpG-like protein
MTDFVTITIDDKMVRAAFDGLPSRVHAAIVRKVHALRLELESKIKGDKLSGQVLHVVSGDLRRSIFSGVEDKGDIVEGWAKQSGDVPYGAIHEFGGIIHIPEILPVKAKALHWVSGGKDVFAKRARAHDVTMPTRSFMRSSLEDMREEIVTGLKDVVLQELSR